MATEDFIDKQTMTIDGKEFTISRIPAFQAQQIYGDIMKETGSVGEVGLTFLSQSTALKLLSYSSFKEDGVWFELDTEDRINRAFTNLLNLIKLEAAMIRKNFGFLFDGSLQSALTSLRGAPEAI